MASSERDMRKVVVRLLKPLHAVSVENGVGIGTPDVNCSLGWIELKSVDQPARPGSPVRAPHWTQEQKLWLRAREAAGGLAALLLKVGDWWILLDAETAYEIVGKVPLGRLLDECRFAWRGQPDKNQLIEALRCWRES